MKIQLSDATKVKAALQKVDEEEYFDAACLFAQVDGYESLLNQIGCFCMLGDYSYASACCRRLFARYIFTHNCAADVRRLGYDAEMVTHMFDNRLPVEFYRRDDKRISADETLLGSFFWPPDGDDDDFDFDEFFSEDDEPEAEPPHKSEFFATDSEQYLQNVHMRMADAFRSGKLELGGQLQQQFLSRPSRYAHQLEMQLFMCYLQHDWQTGVKFARAMLDIRRPSQRAMSMALETLFMAGDCEKDVDALLRRIPDLEQEVPCNALLMCAVQISANMFGCNDITMTLTDLLYDHCVDMGCSAFNLCARVYFNSKDHVRAKEAVLLALDAAPWDGVSRTLLNYINSGQSYRLEAPRLMGDIMRRYDIPLELTAFAQVQLLNAAQTEQPLQDMICYIDCLLASCCTCLLTNNSQRFTEQALILSTVLSLLPDDPSPAWDSFVRYGLCPFLPESTITAVFLRRLIDSGYRGRTFVSVMRGYYALDLGKLYVTDEKFLSAMPLAASVRSVDMNRLQKAFCVLDNTLDVHAESVTERSLAFAMLAIAYKSFATSHEASFFADEERTLYEQYLTLTDV